MTMAAAKVLGARGEAFLEGRGIDLETAVRLGLYTAKRNNGGIVPSPNGDVLVFPYFENDNVVNEKYRTIADKKFWQWQNPKQTFYNSDVLDDPELEKGHQPLIITEGEFDCITAIQCGFQHAVSVPNGAPAKPTGTMTVAAEPEGKYEFAYNNRDKLKKIARFVIAADADGPGRALAEDLVRRLGAGRCFTVSYPDGCKDLNDVLRKHGPTKVTAVLNDAKEWPVTGLHLLSEYAELPPIQTHDTGWPILDQHLRMWLGEFMIVTGIPGHGKSSFVLNLLMNMAKLHGWRSAVFSPEMPVMPFLRDRLRSLFNDNDQLTTDRFINDRFVMIGTDPGRKNYEDTYTLEWLLETAEQAVWRYGIRCLLIDPWNELEHVKRRDEMMTDYIGRSIVALKRFAMHFGVAVIVVAHPTKDIAREGKNRQITLYDIEGSAHWYNKSDHGLVIDCPDYSLGQATIRISKVRLRGTGEKGAVKMQFDVESGRYSVLDVGQDPFRYK